MGGWSQESIAAQKTVQSPVDTVQPSFAEITALDFSTEIVLKRWNFLRDTESYKKRCAVDIHRPAFLRLYWRTQPAAVCGKLLFS